MQAFLKNKNATNFKIEIKVIKLFLLIGCS